VRKVRARAHEVRNGQLARIDALRHLMDRLPPEAKKKASTELAERYEELKLDTRLERLDAAVAENERRIRDLTRQAEEAVARYDYRKLAELLEAAENLQAHNAKLFKIIDRTEEKLAHVATTVAKDALQVTGG
jgi:hypothetical protein